MVTSQAQRSALANRSVSQTIKGNQMSKIAQPRFVNVTVLSKQVGLCERTLQILYRKEGMPHVRIGRAVRFNIDKVSEWLESHYGQNA